MNKITKQNLVSSLLSDSKYKSLKNKDWDKKAIYRGLHLKHNHQLEWVTDMYVNKINRINKVLEEEDLDTDVYNLLTDKIDRLKDKFITAVKEQYMRTNGIVSRNPVGTTYYIDLDNGDDSANGTSTSTAWKTIEKYTTITTRTAGDVAYVRAGTTETKTDDDIVFDEDGTVSSPIKLIGCDSSNDPWGDGIDTKPVINFDRTSHNVHLLQDNYWSIRNIEILHSTDVYVCYIDDCDFVYLEDCTVRYPIRDYGRGFKTWSSTAQLINCEALQSSNSTSLVIGLENSNSVVYARNFSTSGSIYEPVFFNGGSLVLKDCNLQSSTSGIYGVYAVEGKVTLINTTVGHNFSSLDIYAYRAEITCYNLSASTAYSIGVGGGNTGVVHIDGFNGDSSVQRTRYLGGWIERNTSNTRPGGGDTSIAMCPINTHANSFGLSLSNAMPGLFNGRSVGLIKCWNDTNSTNQISIYIKAGDDFGGSYPTADELYVVSWYWSGGKYWSSARSTQTVSDTTSWVEFTNTIYPSANTFIHTDVMLRKYESSDNVIYVDTKPILSSV